MRLDDRHCLSVFADIEGDPGRWGDVLEPSTTTELVTLLARLHRSAPPVPDLAGEASRCPVGTSSSRRSPISTSRGPRGSLAEPARHELATYADDVVERLADLDRFAARDGWRDHLVGTHGEPHPGNLIRGRRRAPPRRLGHRPRRADPSATLDVTGLIRAAGRLYEELTGTPVDPEATAAYELVGAVRRCVFIAQLRVAARSGVDDRRALVASSSASSMALSPCPIGDLGDFHRATTTTPPLCRRFGGVVMVRRTVGGVVVGVVVLAWSAAAWAHVTVQPGEAPKGSFSQLSSRVPNERDDAGTVKLSVQLPTDHPLRSCRSSRSRAGTSTTTTRQLDQPLEGEGSSISEVVDTVTWTATGDTQIAPGQFQLFWISAGQMPTTSTSSPSRRSRPTRAARRSPGSRRRAAAPSRSTRRPC